MLSGGKGQGLKGTDRDILGVCGGCLNTEFWGMLEGTRHVPRGQEGKGGLEILWEHLCA